MDVSMDPEMLLDMKYAELRKIAKFVGIKANQKADKLVKSLQDYITRQRVDTGKPATPVIPMPIVVAPEGKSVIMSTTPLRHSMGKPGTPLGYAGVKPATPLSATRTQPSTPKAVTPLHRLRTPPSGRRSGSFLRTPTCTSATHKRSHTAFGDEVPSAKKQRTNTPVQTAKSHAASLHQRSRTSTYEKATPLTTPVGTSSLGTLDPVGASSPGTLDLLESMAETETETQRKENLMAALDKKVQQKMGESKNTQIPRFVTFCALKKEADEQSAKTGSPGQHRYMKAHAKTFGKMVSLDQYLENKKKRNEALGGSDQKVCADQTSSALKKLRALTEGSGGTKKGDVRRKLVKTPTDSGPSIPFVHKVTSVVKANFDFSAIKKSQASTVRRRSPRIDTIIKGKENADKSAPPARQKSVGVALPARQKSVGVALPARQKPIGTAPHARQKSMGAAPHDRQKSIGVAVTPFRFTANLNKTVNTGVGDSAVKPKFDLGASLNRPMTWKPHMGKLKPFVAPNNFRRDVKAVKVTPMIERRQQSRAIQAQNRCGVQMKRRGLPA